MFWKETRSTTKAHGNDGRKQAHESQWADNEEQEARCFYTKGGRRQWVTGAAHQDGVWYLQEREARQELANREQSRQEQTKIRDTNTNRWQQSSAVTQESKAVKVELQTPKPEYNKLCLNNWNVRVICTGITPLIDLCHSGNTDNTLCVDDINETYRGSVPVSTTGKSIWTLFNRNGTEPWLVS